MEQAQIRHMAPLPIYLDHNATAPILPEAVDAVREASLRFPGNPASQHALGRQARRALESARSRIGELLGAAMTGRDVDRVIFTSGGTEANNLALFGLRRRIGSTSYPSNSASPNMGSADHLLISAIEHPSISRAANRLTQLGWEVDRLGADASGIVRVDQLAAVLRPQTRLVSVMLANNETGVLQPVAEIASVCRERGIPIHTDAVQAVGKSQVAFRALGVDALTCTAHKFHGPLGIGALVVRHGVPFDPLFFGGFQQSALRPGTEAVALAIGMCTALDAWDRDGAALRERLTSLRDKFERAILSGDSRATVLGGDAPRLPQTTNIAFVGLDRQALMMALDLVGVACSTGSACASGSSEPSPTLVAMGLPYEQISASIRFSLGALTTAADIDEATRRIMSVVNRLRREK
jgi:cysteine desulfurase